LLDHLAAQALLLRTERRGDPGGAGADHHDVVLAIVFGQIASNRLHHAIALHDRVLDERQTGNIPREVHARRIERLVVVAQAKLGNFRVDVGDRQGPIGTNLLAQREPTA
jgi:hypothetical protein